MDSKSKANDFFSRFVNWFSAIGNEKESTNRDGGGQDPFSRLMNRISE